MKKIVVIAVACAFLATPAMADLFTFNYGSLTTAYDPTTKVFTADGTTTPGLNTVGTVNRLVPPPSGPATIIFDGVGFENFHATMDITNTNLAGTEADGVNGSLLMTDVLDNDITAGLAGHWTVNNTDNSLHFAGVLTDVEYTNGGIIVDTLFHGDLGVVSMDVDGSTGPWPGVFIDLVSSGLRFDTAGWDPTVGGGAVGTVVPLPGAVLLGLLGLGAAGMRLRKAV